MSTGELRPDEAADPTEFVDLLRQLKDRSRLTYRQLEQRAAAVGDVLARSTAADIVRRNTLPRPEVVAAFVRACGAGDEVEAWLRARHRLAVGAYAPEPPTPDQPSTDRTAPDQPSPDHPSPDRPPTEATVPGVVDGSATRSRWFTRPVPLALPLVGTLLVAIGVGVWIQRPDDKQRRTPLGESTTSASAGPASTPDGGAGPSATSDVSASPTLAPSARLSQIRPARSPQLCVTEGRDRTGQYRHEVAVQRPCAEATPPDTYLEPVSDGVYFIKWNHPAHGVGCLSVRDEDPGRNMLEPVIDCSSAKSSRLFRFESTGSTPTSYRIRPAGGDLCVGLRDDDTEVSAEALAEPCTNGADQVFLVDTLPGR
ncbi:helix-turn-helix domain-containing protein [Micromonospora taraxaci]|uniref:RICIN domain-containing protein n=1 Tax=Micromonospora taraxaci TaxID=1316803 RepID=UPI0033E130B6